MEAAAAAEAEEGTDISKIRQILLLVVVAMASLLVFAIVTVIEIKIYSTFSAFGFAAAVMAGAAGLAGFGTFLDTARIHMFNERSRAALIAVNELIRITIFGIYIYFLDAWFMGIEFGNAAAEVCFTLVIYGLLQLVSKFGNALKLRRNRDVPK